MDTLKLSPEELLAGRDASEVSGADGLLNELKRGLAERILDAELDQHLAMERAGAAEGAPRNHRNGHSRKTVLTGTGSWSLRCRATGRRASSRS